MALHVPQTGASIVTVNHPFGGLDGIIMLDWLLSHRDDVKVLVNGMLLRIPELREVFIGIERYTTTAATCNVKPVKAAKAWVKQGGMLVVFPAGDVSHFQVDSLRVVDTPWQGGVIKIARATDATITPCFV